MVALAVVAAVHQEHLRRRAERRLLAEVVERGFPARRAHQQEPAASDVAGLGVHHRERERRGDRGVHGVAAGEQHLHADLRGDRVLRRDHAVAGTHGHRGRRRRDSREQQQRCRLRGAGEPHAGARGYHRRRASFKRARAGLRAGAHESYDGPDRERSAEGRGPQPLRAQPARILLGSRAARARAAARRGDRAVERGRPGRPRDPAGRGPARGVAPDARRRRDHDPAPLSGRRGGGDGGARRTGALGDGARPQRLARADDPGRELPRLPARAPRRARAALLAAGRARAQPDLAREPHAPQGDHRPAHRPLQLRLLPRAAGARAGAGPAHGRSAGARDVRHRPLQALQRQPRTPGGQPRAAEGGRAAAPDRPARRRRGALRRGGVRGAALRGERVGRLALRRVVPRRRSGCTASRARSPSRSAG